MIDINMLAIRTANNSNIPEIAQLFYDTIQLVNSKDYPQDEIDDWSSGYANVEKWKERILQQYFIIAIYDNIIVGFSSLASDGYLDFMFVHKDFQGQGIAHTLLEAIEKKAKSLNCQFIYSEVSITARLFCEQHGYKVEKQQLRRCKNKYLINFKMTKHF